MPTELDVLPLPLLQQMERYLASAPKVDINPCFWLGPDNRCLHYEYRPEVCRQFELAGEDCRQLRRTHGIDPPDSADTNLRGTI